MPHWFSVLIRPLAVLAAGAALIALVPQELAAQSAPPSAPTSATVTVNERGFAPANVFIQTGGTVTWTDVGVDSHDVETGSAPMQFVLGLSPGQSKSWRFIQSGIYHYTAGTDCLNGVVKALFPCIDYTVVVLDYGTPLPTPAVTPTTTPIPATIPIQPNANVVLTDSGIVPPVVAITQGGSVTWSNQGLNVHTATSTQSPSVTDAFDTNALATGQQATVSFGDTGTYVYNSFTDCLNATQKPNFDCRASYVIVSSQGPGSSVNVPADVQLRNTIAPTVPLSGNTVINVDDSTGFSPRTLTVKFGQTVTFINRGQNVHSVVSDLGILPAFDSGGLSPNALFTWTPAGPGTYRYHSSTDNLSLLDPNCRCSLYGGTVIVGQ